MKRIIFNIMLKSASALFYDMHCHLHLTALPDYDILLKRAVEAGCKKFMLNATKESDWETVR